MVGDPDQAQASGEDGLIRPDDHEHSLVARKGRLAQPHSRAAPQGIHQRRAGSDVLAHGIRHVPPERLHRPSEVVVDLTGHLGARELQRQARHHQQGRRDEHGVDGGDAECQGQGAFGFHRS